MMFQPCATAAEEVRGRADGARHVQRQCADRCPAGSDKLAGAEAGEDRGRRLPEDGGIAVRRTGQGAEDEDGYVPFEDPDAPLLLSRCHLEHRLVAQARHRPEAGATGVVGEIACAFWTLMQGDACLASSRPPPDAADHRARRRYPRWSQLT